MSQVYLIFSLLSQHVSQVLSHLVMSLDNIFSCSIPVVGNGQLSFQHFYISLSRSNFLTSCFFLFQYKKSHSNSARVLPTGPEKVRSPQRLLIPSPPLNGANKNTSTHVKTSKFTILTILSKIFSKYVSSPVK
ncbi:hypothetical protein CEXT_484901 [Caerostris extrusa]|uniref:Uncharacterized protein n=1 Tax=Caerostris extrusa TaxID=172846 RepID=A0AAV4SFI9_CAEEX|nr:hypothetical protein CEXT_484901 [Caerostris extrusa]